MAVDAGLAGVNKDGTRSVYKRLTLQEKQMIDQRKEQQARAERLNKQIEELGSATPVDGERRKAPRVDNPSPREFIHRRMAELDQKQPDTENKLPATK
jgi:hypothetical protein